ncbi:DUF3592 domain-containing protein [Pseudomonas seleniipraecipitans]|uniref:DUF3592 domain-containing protein n=1 Tax=Phytopseudomonas seleniipraecipitans TaxID=640205 RepID=A0A1G7G5Z8_9GAMM|nr:DUF3592 domain-containing protein [Pseudomonas seleniipraecipitans]NQD81528.1 DUF3592 domain-containing protein [Pseudomonas sp. CrR14]UUD63207.1 DUF3592 domain-containing protein [Pseudomonas seleniipraecipitans]SDE83548.1 Protein of unknown function [Pseudomonas seleniipraecipitans]
MPVSVFLALVFGCVGAVLMGIGLSRRRASRDWQQAQGRIIASDWGLNTSSRYPRFEWRDEDGNLHMHESSMSSWRHYRKGDPVPVRYDPTFPKRAVIDTPVQRGASFFWLGVLLCSVSGSFLLVELLLE